MANENQQVTTMRARPLQKDGASSEIVFALLQLHNQGGRRVIPPESKSDFLEVIQEGQFQTYSKGTVIMQEGDEGDFLYIILDGTVQIANIHGETVALGKGDLFGQMSLLIEEPRNATVTAASRRVSVLAISRELLFNNPAVYRALIGNGLVIDGKQDQYELGHKLGEGATAKAYAIHGRKLCAKVHKFHLRFEGDFIAKFINESFLHLQHPNIICTHELIEAYGTSFIIMDYATGTTVETADGGTATCVTLKDLLGLHRLEQETMPVDRAVTVFVHIADALVYTHRKGYVHRDVKPENIFIDSDGRRLKFMLADFGLALPIDTRPQKIGGTPDYFPPETVDIDDEACTLGAAADYYSLGVVCYEMLVGARPFRGMNLPDLVRQHREEPPDLSRLPDEAPEALKQFIAHGLQKKPADRPCPERMQYYIDRLQ